MLYRLRLLMLLLCVAPAAGQAACTLPAGRAGQVGYNSTYKVLQLCDGTSWNNLGAPNQGGGGGPCSNPAGREGQIIYNTSYNVLQYCNGDNWMNMGSSNAGASGSCSSPAGARGKVVYNSSNGKLQYCNSTDWVNAGNWSNNNSGGGGGSAYTDDFESWSGGAPSGWSGDTALFVQAPGYSGSYGLKIFQTANGVTTAGGVATKDFTVTDGATFKIWLTVANWAQGEITIGAQTVVSAFGSAGPWAEHSITISGSGTKTLTLSCIGEDKFADADCTIDAITAN